MRLPALLDVQRELARRGLLDFTRYTFPTYQAGWFHAEVAGRLDAFLQAVAERRSPRLMLFAPPRSGKSELVSRRFPAYAFGRYPDLSMIATSYSGELSRRLSRDVQRVMDDPRYVDLFPGSRLFGSNVRTVAQGTYLRNSDVFEVVGKRGIYRSAGTMGSITGMGCDVLIVDDPVKDMIEAESSTYRERLWEWFTSTAYTRLAPGGGVLFIMCMTGDTPVLMANGVEKPLREVRPGDSVASYKDGALTASTVRNWRNQGPDSVYEIRTRAGRLLRANERHPFLVCRDGELEWVRLRYLKPGDVLVGANGGEPSAPSMVAPSPLAARASAGRTTARTDGPEECAHRPSTPGPSERGGSSTGTGSPSRSTRPPASSSKGDAPSAVSHHPARTPAPTGPGSSASITTTSPVSCGACSATTATSRSDTARPPRSSSGPLGTYSITHDEIVSVTPAGVEDVFDIEVEGTENFIANGIATHNTRWHEDDLAGRLLAAENDGGEKWEVVRYPAIAEHDEPFRKEGEALHPERYDAAALARIRLAVGARVWISLFQQRPSAAQGSIFKREYWRTYKPTTDNPRDLIADLGINRVLQAWDTGFKTKTTNDPSAGITIGVAANRYYLLDCWRGRVEYPDLKRVALAQAAKWNPYALLIEDAASGQSLIQDLKRETRLPVVPIKPDRDKVARANAITPQLEAGLVYLPEGAEWLADFMDECATFPLGMHDDQVDALTMGLGYVVGGGGGLGLWEFFREEAARVAAQRSAGAAPT